MGFGYSALIATPLYDATAQMIVNSGERYADYVSTDQLNSAASLVDTYAIIITGETVMSDVRSDLGIKTKDDFEKVVKSITVKSVNDTQIMEIRVVATDPKMALDVCEEITQISPDVIIEAVSAGSVKLIQQPTTTNKKISPNTIKNTILAGGLGFFISAAVVLILALLDNKVKTENDIKMVDLPVLGIIPTYELEDK